jgi:DNA binding domain, excisionase family
MAISSAKCVAATSAVAAAMTVPEAADYLRISESGVRRLVRSGQLKSALLAGRRLVRRVDVDALLASALQNA